MLKLLFFARPPDAGWRRFIAPSNIQGMTPDQLFSPTSYLVDCPVSFSLPRIVVMFSDFESCRSLSRPMDLIALRTLFAGNLSRLTVSALQEL